MLSSRRRGLSIGQNKQAPGQRKVRKKFPFFAKTFEDECYIGIAFQAVPESACTVMLMWSGEEFRVALGSL